MAVSERYRSIADLPQQVAAFPLAGCILLPRTTLPLNVFEPRYLRMIDDVIAGDRLLAIVQPASASGTGGESPAGKDVALRAVACVGRLTAFEEQPDGRMRIMLSGVARCAVLGEVETPLPYRRLTVDFARFAADLERGAGEGEVDRDTLVTALRQYLETKRMQADWEAIERSSSETLINALALASPYGPEEKQALLEALTLKERAEVLVTLARMELAATNGAPSPDPRRRLQ